jgi:hypothetical protein
MLRCIRGLNFDEARTFSEYRRQQYTFATMTPPMLTDSAHEKLRSIPLSYSNEGSENSALALVYTLQPEWKHAEGPVKIIKFTDGITNTVSFLLTPTLTSRA